jgi:hypothetical protein
VKNRNLPATASGNGTATATSPAGGGSPKASPAAPGGGAAGREQATIAATRASPSHPRIPDRTIPTSGHFPACRMAPAGLGRKLHHSPVESTWIFQPQHRFFQKQHGQRLHILENINKQSNKTTVQKHVHEK